MKAMQIYFLFVIALLMQSPALGSVIVSKSAVEFPFSIELDLFYAHSEEIYKLRQQSNLGPLKMDDADLSRLVQSRNQDVVLKFKRTIGNSGLGFPSPKLKQTADGVLKKLLESPVASPNALAKYDPLGEVGFCFGRATFVHLELIRLGFDPNKIGKVFALGNLSYQKRPWDFHVATFIWDNDATLVIDDTVKEVMTLEQWIQTIEKFDFDPDAPMMTVFLTDPIKFHPALKEYDKRNFQRPIYNNYFKDLVRSLSFNLNSMFLN